MPVVKHKKKKFLLRWKPEWDRLLLKTIKKNRYKNGRIDWKSVRNTGILDIIPVSFTALCARPTYLKNRKSKKWLAKDNEKSKARWRQRRKKGITTWHNDKRRMDLLKELPENDKKKVRALRPNKLYLTPKQKQILKALARKYKHGKLIYWVKAIRDKDPRIKLLPKHHQNRKALSIDYHRLFLPKQPTVYPKLSPEKLREYKIKSVKRARKKRRLINNMLYKKLENLC